MYDNLAFGLRRRGVERAEIDRRVPRRRRQARPGAVPQRKPHALSGGQRQRVALGRAIVREPKVFLFDEPLSNLDAALRVTTRNELIKQQHEIGTTTIYVTHDQVEAMTMGHRICIMNKGEVVQIGRRWRSTATPADTFVARFLGNPPMNLLPGGSIARRPARSSHLAAGAVVAERTAGGARRHGRRDVTARASGRRTCTRRRRRRSVRIALPARVVAVEPLGAETLLLMALDGSNEELMARIGRDTALRSGERIEIALDTAAIHLFDPATTKAIV